MHLIMKLTDKQIKEITKGAYSIEQENGVLVFYRMPKEITAKYQSVRGEMYIRTLASSGIRFDFLSDTKYLKIRYFLKKGSSQNKGAFDVWVNGRLYGSEGEDIIDGDSREIEFCFEGGEKHITVYFPTLSQTFITSVELSDGATLTPFENKPLALFFGDSITQGYITELPSMNYVTRFSEMSGYDFYNYAVGGDIYNSIVTENVPDRKPEIIFVSYGTNDWSGNLTSGALKKNMRDFYSILYTKYPSSKIVAILPIWRDVQDRPTREIGEFENLHKLMRTILSEFPKVKIIDGLELVPHSPRLLADKYLHPKDTGFEFYANALFEKMSK